MNNKIFSLVFIIIYLSSSNKAVAQTRSDTLSLVNKSLNKSNLKPVLATSAPFPDAQLNNAASKKSNKKGIIDSSNFLDKSDTVHLNLIRKIKKLPNNK